MADTANNGGGLYGGGGGGNTNCLLSGAGNGAQGIIVITYDPVVAPTCTLSVSHPTVPHGATIELNWTTTGSPTSASIDNSIGSVSTSGGATTTVPTSTTTYTLSVSNAGGSSDCTATVTVDDDKIVFLTSGSSWTVPSDWNNASNTVEVIGGGGSNASTGAGGGAYAEKNDLSLTPGGSASYQIGNIASNSGDTWFSSTGTVLAKGGNGESGGAAGSSVGDAKYSGGDGDGSKGGGAGGPNGDGGDGGTGGEFDDGGGDGDAGFGGIGARGLADGGDGTEWDALHGSGAGGGASASFGGGSGGLYGGGGALNFGDTPGSGISASGLIVITYTPVPTGCTLVGTPPTIAQGATAGIAWTTTNATSASIDNGIGSVSTGSGATTTAATTTTTYTMTVTGATGTSTCSATVTFDSDKIVFLTSGSSWTVPDDWNNASNTIEAIGGSLYKNVISSGGGAYARKNNLSLTTDANVAYHVGALDGSGNNTWFESTSTLLAAGPSEDNWYIGGQASDSVGDVTYSGGDGDDGGGGAAGPNGDGLDASGSTGGAGDAGYGGAGGSVPGESGGNGSEWDALHGSGGGDFGEQTGGSGGLYGGGGSSSNEGGGGPGAQGLIVITYTPITAPGTPGTPTFSGTTATSTTVSWSAASGATTYKIERCAGTGCSSYTEIASGVSGTSYNDTGTLSSNTTYRYRVRGTNGVGDGSYSTPAEVTTLAANATCTLSASPSGIVPGGSSTLSWTTTNATGASIDNGVGSVSTGSGSTSVSPANTTTYTLTASGDDGDGTCTATVAVSKSAATFFGGHVIINGSHLYIR